MTRHRPAARRIALALPIVLLGCAGGAASPSASSDSVMSPTAAASAPAARTPSPTTGLPSSNAPATDAGPWIAYQRWAGEATEIALVHADGSDDHALPVSGTPSDDLAHPDWSPSGDRIAFDVFFDSLATPGKPRVEPWVVGVDGGAATRLVTCELPCLQLAYPTWSPDGTRLAVLRYDVDERLDWGVSALEIVDLATGERREVAATADGLEAWYFPRWSPDGTTIVLVTETYTDVTQAVHTSMALGTLAVDGPADARPSIITAPEILPREVDWGWANDRLVLSVVPALPGVLDRATVVTMAPDGTDLVPLDGATPPGSFGLHPSWTPDGTSVVFTTTGSTPGAPTIGLVAADGSGRATIDSAGRPRTHPRMQPTP